MAVRNTKLSGTDWTAESPTFQDLNDTNDRIADALLGMVIPAQTYTATGFDSDSSGTATANHTLTSSTGLNYSKLIVEVTFKASASVQQTYSTASAKLRIETSEASAASWTDLLPTTTVTEGQEDNDGDKSSTCCTIKLVHTLAAGEKTNGLDIKFTSTCADGGGASVATFNNIQTNLYYA